MRPQDNFNTVIAEIEALDAEFRKDGIPERYKKKWSVDVNVGLWIAGRETAEWLYQLVLREKPQRILELGTSVGYTALWLGKAATQYGAHVDTVERELFKVTEAREYIERAHLEKIISCFHGDILYFIQNMKKENQPSYDFVFIDAGKREYADYLQLLEPMLMPNAHVVADNMRDFALQTKAYRDYLAGNHGYQNLEIDIGNGLMYSRKIK